MLPALLLGASVAAKGISALLGRSAQQQAADANKKAANTAYALTLADIAARAQQEERATMQSLTMIRQESLAALGTTKASAAEANVGGISNDLLLGALDSTFYSKKDTTKQNLDMSLDQLGRQAQDADAQRLARINQVQGPGSILPDAVSFGAETLATVSPYLMNRTPKVRSSV